MTHEKEPLMVDKQRYSHPPVPSLDLNALWGQNYVLQEELTAARERITALEALARDVARLPVQWDADTTFNLIHRAQALVPQGEGR